MTIKRLLITTLALLSAARLYAQAPRITAIEVQGNARVEAEAIVAALQSQRGEALDRATVQRDLRSLYGLGYFSNIEILREDNDTGITLIVRVEEKPAIVAIEFRGLEEIKEESLREQLNTKLYTIVDESAIADDVQMIEQQYAQKGYYLAAVTYTLRNKGDNERVLVFDVIENHEVKVGAITILGNERFSDRELIDKFIMRPTARIPTFKTAVNFQEDLLKRDLSFLAAFYRDHGFAEAKVAKPLLMLSRDRRLMDVTYRVEEGAQYRIGSVIISGDTLPNTLQVRKKLLLREGGLFRFSQFRHDIEMLMDSCGDLGHAYADVNPNTRLDREKQLVHIDYEITKGEKVYIGKIDIIGNTKTRDNVIRREFEIHDSELYSGTKLSRSKANVERLGFFDAVQISRARDKEAKDLLNLKVKVKERSTGQLQAALIFTPGSGSGRSGWAGQGRYDEKNQSGRGWSTNLTGKWDGRNNYTLSLGFNNPRLYDSHWSLGTSAFYMQESRRYANREFIEESRRGGTLTLGRKLFEHVYASATWKLQKTALHSDTFVLQKFREEGIASSIKLSLARNAVNDFLEPSSGSRVSLSQVISGGTILRGDKKFLETSLDAAYYYPIDFVEGYRTYFRLRGLFSYIYPLGSEPVPFLERYRLGGFNDMRGYPYWEIGPKFYVMRDPDNTAVEYNRGGNRKLLLQAEYFVPLIQEARIKALVFADVGRVYDDNESLSLRNLYSDVGFGLRWITPIAPLRFEWAFPFEHGKLGDMEFIFYLGF